MRRLARAGLLVLSGLVFFVVSLRFGSPVTQIGLDASWTHALGEAYLNGLQAGRDYVFSYGPLGYFMVPGAAFVAEIFPFYFLFRVVLSASVTAALMGYAVLIRTPAEQIAYVGLLVFLFSLVPHVHVQLLAVAAVALATRGSSFDWRVLARLTPLIFLLSVTALGKFSHFVLAALAVTLISSFWASRSGVRALSIPAVSALAVALAWIGGRQDLLGLPLFIFRSIEVAKGYSAAMARLSRPVDVSLALAVMALLIVLVLRSRSRVLFSQERVVGFMALGTTFIAWKEHFVRQESPRAVGYFALILLIPFFLPAQHADVRSRARGQSALRGLIGCLCIAGFFHAGGDLPRQPLTPKTLISTWTRTLGGNFRLLRRPAALAVRREQATQTLRENVSLPAVRAAVGRRSIDVFSYEQSTVFLNDLEWSPRPVFQSYVTYSPALAALNEAYLASERAPHFVLFKLQSIDRRFPPVDEAPGLIRLFQDYRIVLEEEGYLLLQRSPAETRKEIRRIEVLSKVIFPGEPLALGDFGSQGILVSLGMRKTLLGSLVQGVYRLPEVFIRLNLARGGEHRYRIIPDTASRGFLVNPTLLRTLDMKDWLNGGGELRAEELVLEPLEGWHRWLFSESVEAVVTRIEVLSGENLR